MFCYGHFMALIDLSDSVSRNLREKSDCSQTGDASRSKSKFIYRHTTGNDENDDDMRHYWVSCWMTERSKK